ncbi:hypothetical protein [Streptomyces boluensis]|uniref:Uncharacterized protein n=1 Tax=Streptomyces boluensis TaxID=1775135 RepID=A0A964UXY1_9ACTN|nr:hypothetical protein [Streptomyces boluensis]NBE54887.1 hypothetical protein [Streptomyces boluensis]
MYRDYDFGFELYVQLRERVGGRKAWPYGFQPARRMIEIIYSQLGHTDSLRFLTCALKASESQQESRAWRARPYRDLFSRELDAEFGEAKKQQLDTAWLIFNTVRDVAGAEHSELLVICAVHALKADEPAYV